MVYFHEMRYVIVDMLHNNIKVLIQHDSAYVLMENYLNDLLEQ